MCARIEHEASDLSSILPSYMTFTGYSINKCLRIRYSNDTHLMLDVLEVSLKQVRFPHRAIQPFVGLRIHITNNTLHQDIPWCVRVRMNFDCRIPIFALCVVFTLLFVVLKLHRSVSALLVVEGVYNSLEDGHENDLEFSEKRRWSSLSGHLEIGSG